MEELLKRLESQLKQLIDNHQELKMLHEQQHHSCSIHQREKNLLLAKQQKAATQIESLLTKLKTIENSAHD